MSAVSPALLRFAADLSAAPSVHRPHQVMALTARGFGKLLTPGELWFLGMVAKLPKISASQSSRLLEIACKVERSRK